MARHPVFDVNLRVGMLRNARFTGGFNAGSAPEGADALAHMELEDRQRDLRLSIKWNCVRAGDHCDVSGFSPLFGKINQIRYLADIVRMVEEMHLPRVVACPPVTEPRVCAARASNTDEDTEP
jgi:hypothetical protein